MASNKVFTRDLYYMDLNLVHRRLYLSDNYRLVNTPPQKRFYKSCGCLLKRCKFNGFWLTCNNCTLHYDISEL